MTPPTAPQRAEPKGQECVDGQAQSCFIGACEGARECDGGFYGECVGKTRVCVPNSTLGCSIDGCRFGYRKCNGCGTGFGECVPAPQTDKGCASGGICN